jgi:peptidoglycan/LPS O-acetylase OafA/YrhL
MLPWIDALRGLAILMVLANHVALVVPGLSAPLEALARFGQMGVQLFFVASAYTLCLSWQQRHRGEAQPVRRFLVRRFFRIAPLYYLGIALFAGLHHLQSGVVAAEPYTAGNVLANAAFVHGFVPAAQNSIVPGGWSIGVEMAFYALFPLLVTVQAALPARWAGVRSPLLGAVTALGLNLAWHTATGTAVGNNSTAYFHPLNQLPVFLLGMGAFEWQRQAPARPWWPAAATAACALVATALLWRAGWALSFVLIPASAGLAFAALTGLAGHMPARAIHALGAVGRLSFAVYVIHTLFAWHTLRPLVLALGWRGDTAYLLALAGVTLASCLAARGLARWVEQPGIACGRFILRSSAPAAPSPAGAR